ncbi:MAG: helix-turn-helix domain-containing protein [Planctomycetes bacterium]|nr:helix-turn-helix domain-containing protein [Planctomycetota bacterium]
MKLGKDDIVTLQVLIEKGESNRAIAKRLNVSEGADRYHLRRQAAGGNDGRQKLCLIEELGLEQAIEFRWQFQRV